MNVLEVITRLKQVCNVCPRTQRSAKLDDLSPRLEEIVASGHRALVFSQWTNERFGVGRIAEGIRHLHPLVYSGAMSGPARDACVDRFRDDPQHGALLLSLRAGGQGLNLQEASYVVHFDRWWNPAVENQATDRAHRAGQLNPVTVYCYSVVDSIEERIEQILEEKRALFAALVDGVSLDPRRFLTRDEVFGLLDLSAPPASAAARRFARDGIVAGVEGALRSAGWRVTRTRASGQAILLSVRRREGGADRRGWVACAGADAAADGLVLLTDAEVSDPAVVRMLVTDGPVDQDVTRAAADQGIPVLEAGDRVSV